jgi:hypothetical protein
VQVLGLIIFVVIIYSVSRVCVYLLAKDKPGFYTSRFTSLVLAICIAATPIIVSEISTPEIEWNPLIRDNKVVIGKYNDENAVLELMSDNTFIHTHGNKIYQGTWNLDDWNLTFNSRSTGIQDDYLRVIYHSGAYYLVKNTYNQDPDGWGYKNAYAKEKI